MTITGGGGTGATAYAQINSNGQVFWICLLSVGSGYTSTPTVTITGGGGTGATATATVDDVIVGRAWQFYLSPPSRVLLASSYPHPLLLNFWKTGVPSTYPYTMVNECLFGPATSAAAYPGLPSRSAGQDLNVATDEWITTPTPKYPACIRCMGIELEDTDSCVVDPSDLKNANDFIWTERVTYNVSNTYAAANPTGSRTINLPVIRTYALSPTGLASIAVTAGGSGYTSPPGVIISDSAGTGAAATATIVGGAVNSITMTADGSGYVSPSVSFSGGGGTGATATATVGYPAAWNVNWSSPNVYASNPGTGGSTVVSVNPGWQGYGNSSSSGGGPYVITPPTIGWLNVFGSTSGMFAAEFVTSSPHNLKTGQYLTMGGTGSFSVSNRTKRHGDSVQSRIQWTEDSSLRYWSQHVCLRRQSLR